MEFSQSVCVFIAGILLVYDVTDEQSFQNIRNWIRNIEQHASDNVDKLLVHFAMFALFVTAVISRNYYCADRQQVRYGE
jgi:hypothetical protein